MTVGSRKKFDDTFSRLDTIHECDRQTDRQMDTDQWLVPRLRMTLSGKNIAYIKSIPFCLKRNVAFKQNSSKKRQTQNNKY